MSSFSAPSYSSFIPPASAASSSGLGPLKTSAIVSLTFGLVSSGLYYLFLRSSRATAQNQDQIEIVKRELIKELRQRSFNPPKDQDYTFPLEFMIYLYKQLYTYQTIGREVLKEQIFAKRIAYLREEKTEQYKELLDGRQTEFSKAQLEIKEIVFDYFNIITKEYELSYEKWRGDKEYQDQIAAIKAQVDDDFVEKKFDVLPEHLTIEKTREIMQKKQAAIDGIFMRMLEQGQPNGQGQVMIGQSQLVYEIAKFDDDIFLTEGVRKEHMDAAVKKYGLGKEDAAAETTSNDEEWRKLGSFANNFTGGAVREPQPVPTAESGGLSRSTGKTINLD